MSGRRKLLDSENCRDATRRVAAKVAKCDPLTKSLRVSSKLLFGSRMRTSLVVVLADIIPSPRPEVQR